jgi:site-specific DNA-methyltransferase (adenine-specific)
MTDDFYTGVYNPDVLSCLANLSNDEVFTPPGIVNQMLDLLPQDLFKSPDTKFLDPACKSGVFLREIAKRLLKGLEPLIPNLQERTDHIFKQQLYGIALTELTSLLSRRGTYCSKYPNSDYSVTKFNTAEGNIRFKRINHYWVNGKCLYCGASKDQYDRDSHLETHAYELVHTTKPEEIFKMKFDVIIGNPPYQLNDGGGTGSSAIPIYQYFVRQAEKLNPRFLSMIIPSRWYAGGKGLDDFRHHMITSRHISVLFDFPNSADCFPGVIIAGGVCYFLWEKDHEGSCSVINMKGAEVVSENLRDLNEFEVFVRDNTAVEIIRKVKEKSSHFIDEIVYPRNCFNLYSKETGHKAQNPGDCVLYSLNGKSFIERSKVQDRNQIIDKYKVIMTKAMSGGNKPSSDGDYLIVSSTLRVLLPNEVCTETYLCLGNFENMIEATNLESYVKTKFFRFLLLQSLTSINISKDKFRFIPLMDFSIQWTDEELYKLYSLSDHEIDLIESMIKPIDLGGEENAK